MNSGTEKNDNEIPAKPLHEFSKEYNQGGRDALAREIRERRAMRHEQIKEAKEKLEGAELEIVEALGNMETLTRELEELNETGFSRLVNCIKIKRLQRELDVNAQSKEKAESVSYASERVLDDQVIRADSLPQEFEQSKRLIEDFYKKEKEKWREMPYDAAEVEKYFNTDYLERLSLEDYVILLKRFNSDMVTHVTRQGIRDHTGMMEHHVGVGQKWNGFTGMLQSKKLIYSIESCITKQEKEKALAAYLGLEEKTEEEAIAFVNHFTNPEAQHWAASFVDFHAVHFAVKDVADEFYGAERGNEIFYAFPSYMIEANYHHRRNAHDKGNAHNYNDVWAYIDDNSDFPVNAGIVFLPKNAPVDPETGSKYEINKEGNAQPDHKCIDTIKSIIQSEGFAEFASKAELILGKSHAGDIDEKVKDELKESLLHIAGDSDKETIDAFFEYAFLSHIRLVLDQKTHKTTTLDTVIGSRLSDMGLYFKKADTTIPSEEYWENYFKSNPELKPSKIVYYEGNDPTAALERWRYKNQLSFKEPVNVPDRRLMENSLDYTLPESVLSDMNRFRSIAMKVIEDFYSEKRSI